MDVRLGLSGLVALIILATNLPLANAQPAVIQPPSGGKAQAFPTDKEVCLAHLQMGEDFCSLGNFPEAEAEFRAALRSSDDPIHRAMSLRGMTIAAMSLGRYDEGRRLIDQSLAAAQSAVGKDHPFLLRFLCVVAASREPFDQFDEAETIARRALEIAENSLPPDDIEMFECLKNMGAAKVNLRKYPEAETFLLRSKDILDRQKYPYQGNWCLLYTLLGRASDGQDRRDEAERYLKMAIQSLEKSSANSNNVELIKPFVELSKLYIKENRYQDAMSAIKRARSIYEKQPHENPTIQAFWMRTYADLLRALGRDEEAKEYEARIDQIRKSPEPMPKHAEVDAGPPDPR